jgi:hypothetical protein
MLLDQGPAARVMGGHEVVEHGQVGGIQRIVKKGGAVMPLLDQMQAADEQVALWTECLDPMSIQVNGP